MPTTRPRHTITETDEIAAALHEAALRWPDQPPTRLLALLIIEGRRALHHNVENRRAVIAANAGALTGTYEPGYLEALRAEWLA
ncbi:hypothetical protein F0L68_18060 [Solihabitans fulvus]|uniref:Uncharacterized protein n=1 Tax=Solihabitans fulvus TaxID=1892852 RepID=A0A5B2XCU5_9PSEU|nr:hypothetical protein [Solihabitans fulvus]KAA2261143.1 hypothetical protein F0L68_18060 [Solihabitans fulvus]